MYTIMKKSLFALFLTAGLSFTAFAQSAMDPPPVDPGEPDPECSAPVASMNPVIQCGFDSTTVTVDDIGCTVEWYLASFGMGNGPLQTGPSFKWAFSSNDTLLVRYLCDSTCITEFTRIPVKVLTPNQNAFNLTPSSGVVGDEITVTGGGISDILELRLNGQAMAFRRTVSGGGQALIFGIPSGGESGTVEAITGDTTTCTAKTNLTVTGQGADRRIANGAIAVCSGTYTDPQGAGANYSNNLYVTQTLLPGTGGAKVQLDFTTVQLADNDQLYVYNGPSASSALLFRSVGGSTSPGKLVSTDASGALTIRFYANGSGNAEGFAATISCNTSSTPPPVVSSVSTKSGVNGQKVTILGTNLTGATSVRFGINSASFVVKNSQTVEATIPFGAATGYVSVETSNGVAPSPTKFMIVDTVKHFAGSTFMCGGIYTDPQGPNANYNAGLYQALTIQPTAPGRKIMLDFSQFDVAAGDQMYIYDGTNTAAPLLKRYIGGQTAVAPDTVMATGSSGALTIRFYSDGSVQGAGWMAAFSCVTTPVPSPSPARLGDSNLSLESFSFWPNPAKDKLTVKADNVAGGTLILFDATGKAAFRTNVQSGTTEVALPRLTPGLYMLKLGSHTARLAVE